MELGENNLLDAEKDLRIKGLEKEIEKLTKENAKYKQALQEVGITDTEISDEEAIARTQLALLRLSAKERPLTIDEVRAYDILHKNLRQLVSARPKIDSKEEDNMSDEELAEFLGNLKN